MHCNRPNAESFISGTNSMGDRMKIESVQMINCFEWDKLVMETYGRVYNFQKQDGCRSRGKFEFDVPFDDYAVDEGMNDSIPEEVNGSEMGVKFAVWLERDPKEPIPNQEHDYQLEIFWERKFYPAFGTLVNDLHSKGLIEAGEYIIDIDW